MTKTTSPALAGPEVTLSPSSLLFTSPTVADGAFIWQLVRDCPPLDLNSPYCYLLLCQHCADSCVVARAGHDLAGAITAFVPPGRPDVLFVWQVAVAPDWRGCGVAGAMLEQLRQRPSLAAIRFVETTVAAGNAASRRFFTRHAQRFGAAVEEHTGFSAHHFPASASQHPHDAEPLLRIGPFPPATETQQ